MRLSVIIHNRQQHISIACHKHIQRYQFLEIRIHFSDLNRGLFIWVGNIKFSGSPLQPNVAVDPNPLHDFIRLGNAYRLCLGIPFNISSGRFGQKAQRNINPSIDQTERRRQGFRFAVHSRFL
ncbi:hypothetical protein D3C73_1108600 [compost metagenome]